MAKVGELGAGNASSTVKLPLWEKGDSNNEVIEVVSVETPSGTAFVPFAHQNDAVFPYIKVETAGHGILAAHNAPIVSYWAPNLSQNTFINVPEVYDVEWNDDGSKFFSGTSEVTEHTASTNYDITTLTEVDSYSFTTQETVYSFTWGDSGSKLYCLGVGEAIYEANASTPYDVSTVGSQTKTDYNNAGSFEGKGLLWNDDGSEVIVGGDGELLLYSASPAWDSTSLTLSTTVPLSYSPNDIIWGDDGDRFYVLEDDTGVIQYRTGTAYDVTSLTEEDSFTDAAGALVNEYGFAWNGDGSAMVISDQFEEEVHEYKL